MLRRFTVGLPVLAAMVALTGISGATAAQAHTTKSPCEKAYKDSKCHHVNVHGHRFRDYSDPKNNNEDTLAALKYVHAHGIKFFETDVWQSADQKMFIWHGATWGTVATPASLKKAGLKKSDRVTDATYAQVKMVRTTGGQAPPSLKRIMKYAIRQKMLGKFQLKSPLFDPAGKFAYAKSLGSTRYVTFYQTPGGTCATEDVDAAHAAGFTIGVKETGACPQSAATLAGKRYVMLLPNHVTASRIAALHKAGIRVGNTDTDGAKSDWGRLVKAGVDFIITPHPVKLKAWLG